MFAWHEPSHIILGHPPTYQTRECDTPGPVELLVIWTLALIGSWTLAYGAVRLVWRVGQWVICSGGLFL
jgi:hypothetical protein